jgi:uncharacterized membrane protein YesL
MGNLFNMDNGIFAALGKICDIIFLSVIYILVCIPIITIGPANTALYYATVKVIRRERGYLFREFFKSFCMNFKRGAIIGLVLNIIYTILVFDLIWGWANLSNSKGSILFGLFVAITFLVLSVSTYIYPLLSRFDMTIKQLVKAAAFMSMRHLPFTFLMVVLTAGAILGALLIPILMFVIPVGITFLNSLMMERILKKYMPQAEETEESTGKDEWYLE